MTAKSSSTIPSPLAYGLLGVVLLAVTTALLTAGAGILGWLLLVVGVAVVAACVVAFGVAWGLDLHEQRVTERVSARTTPVGGPVLPGADV